MNLGDSLYGPLDPAGWHVENLAVTYEWEKAARVAEQNKRPD